MDQLLVKEIAVSLNVKEKQVDQNVNALVVKDVSIFKRILILIINKNVLDVLVKW